jgi:hypothetical protein
MKKLLTQASLFVATLGLTLAGLIAPASAVTPGSCPLAFYGTGSVPSNSGTSPATGVDIGVKFTTRGSAITSGIRFYADAGETGPFTVHLADASGTELASATASAVGSSGWYEGTFSSPVSTPAGDYIAWRNADAGGNPYLTNGLNGGIGNPGDVAYVKSGNSGLYDTQPHSGVPSTTTNTGYFISPVSSDSTAPGAPTVTADVNAASVTLHVSGGYDGTNNDGTAQRRLYRNGTIIADLDGTAESANVTILDKNVTGGAGYTYTVKSADFCGNLSSASAGASVAASSEETVFGNQVPYATDTSDTSSVELGMRVTPAVNGYITGVRFYRTVANANGYVANLWSDGGTNLATGSTLTGGSVTPGWNEIRFSSPVAVTANTTYVVSYFTDAGQYSYTPNAFASAVTNGDLTAPADSSGSHNGVYSYNATSGFPTSSYNANSYAVDAIFAQ